MNMAYMLEQALSLVSSRYRTELTRSGKYTPEQISAMVTAKVSQVRSTQKKILNKGKYTADIANGAKFKP